jgi:hypothetical protein
MSASLDALQAQVDGMVAVATRAVATMKLMAAHVADLEGQIAGMKVDDSADLDAAAAKLAAAAAELAALAPEPAPVEPPAA